MNALAVPLAAAVTAVAILLPLPAAAAPPDAPSAVFQCSTRDGRTVFSDEPCVGAPRVRVWAPRSTAQGIERSTPVSAPPATSAAILAATAMGQAQRGEAADYGPYVNCQRRGGRLDLATRICHLPDDAARQMFNGK